MIAFCTVVAGSVLAVANSNSGNRNGQPNGQGMAKMSGITGKIASIDGSKITLESDDSYTITINATSATVKKLVSATSSSSATSTDITVSDLKVGDIITAKGNISVDATEITAGTVKPTATTNGLGSGLENQTQNQGMLSRVKSFFGNLFKK